MNFPVPFETGNQPQETTAERLSRIMHLNLQEIAFFLRSSPNDENVSLLTTTNREALGITIDTVPSKRSTTEQSFSSCMHNDRREEETNVESIFHRLLQNMKQQRIFEKNVMRVLSENRRPSKLSANWLPYSLISLSVLVIIRSIYKEKAAIYEFVCDVVISTINFYKRYFEEPLQNIYTTIRYDTSNLNVISQKAMEADMDSLGRMVIEFLKRYRPELGDQQIEQITAEARNGNLSPILPLYENSIQSPIKEAFFGNLIQLILIQVHKQKVDLERAMLALDKLLKSNELNFEALGMIPAIVVSALGIRFFYRYVYGRMSEKTIYRYIQSELRKVERLLDLSIPNYLQEVQHIKEGQKDLSLDSPTTFRMNLDTVGRLLLSISKLKKFANGLIDSQRIGFLEDLADLEVEQNHTLTKVMVVHRMYHCIRFFACEGLPINRKKMPSD